MLGYAATDIREERRYERYIYQLKLLIDIQEEKIAILEEKIKVLEDELVKLKEGKKWHSKK